MELIYNQEEAIQMYGESERYDEKIEVAARMIADGDLPIDKIAKYSGLALEKVIELQKGFNLCDFFGESCNFLAKSSIKDYNVNNIWNFDTK